MTPILLDTDPGIDDAMALLYALADPAVNLRAVTTIFGNVPTDIATRNASCLLALGESPAPVAGGATAPLEQAAHPHPDFVHGAGGFGEAALPHPMRPPLSTPAHTLMAERCAGAPGQITLVAVGPLTNLALALRHHPEIARDVKRVVVMGGAVRTKGNVTDHAEANIWQDPHAAAAVFAAEWPVTLVGLDVTEQVRLTAEDLAPMTEKSPRCGRFLNHAAEFYFRFHKSDADLDGCHLHDPTAIIAALDPSLFETVETPITVTVDGEEAGRTVESPDAETPPVTVCTGIDADAVHTRFLRHLMSGKLP